MGRKRMVPDPDNAQALVEGDLVRVVSAEEPTSYLTLEDGTEITHRTSVLESCTHRRSMGLGGQAGVQLHRQWDDQD